MSDPHLATGQHPSHMTQGSYGVEDVRGVPTYSTTIAQEAVYTSHPPGAPPQGRVVTARPGVAPQSRTSVSRLYLSYAY